jgi:hypothetical protein
MAKRLIVAAAIMAAAAFAAAQEPAPPAMHFSARGATISAATPNSSAAVIGIGLKADGFFPRTFKWAGVVACNGKGEGAIDFGFDVPGSTLWAVVDGRTGQASLVAPGGVPVPEAQVRPGMLHRKGAGVSLFAFDHPVLDLLYVEPGGGAWVGSTADGAKSDRDGPNGVSAISVDDFRPLGSTSGAPREFKPGGRLIAIDYIRMQALSLRLDAAMIGAAR